MTAITPAFVTNHEIDALLGGGKSGERRRQRFHEQGRLPEPQWLRRIDRFRLAVYPVFALAGLLSLAQADDVRGRLSALSEAVFGSAAYNELAEALRDCASTVLKQQGSSTWDFDAVARQMGAAAGPVVVEWEAVVHEAVESLAPWGVRVSSEFGAIEEEGPVYVVSLGDRLEERFDSSHVAGGLHKGSHVGVEHVRVRGQGLDFVMPALQVNTATSTSELDWSDVSSADWEEAFQRSQMAAADASFDASYWHETDAEPSQRFCLPADLPSAREAARRLLAAQGS